MLQGLIDKVYPKIEFIDIDLNAAFINGKWQIKELWHHPKSALLTGNFDYRFGYPIIEK